MFKGSFLNLKKKQGWNTVSSVGYWQETLALDTILINSKPVPCMRHISGSGQYREIKAYFWTKRRSAANRFRAWPILSCLLCCFYTTGASILSLLKGEADKYKNCEFSFRRAKINPLRL
jgi:hypothetical protein